MKIYQFILFGLISLALFSCKLDGVSESTPGFYLVKIMHIAGNDTTHLNFQGNTLDTISVGDTITFQSVVYSQYNKLLQYNITSSREKSVEFLWGEKEHLDSIFTSSSDYDKGLFVMDGTFSELYFPFKYVAKEAEKDLKLTFSVLNDASSNYNSTTVTIVTPIKEAVQEENTTEPEI